MTQPLRYTLLTLALIAAGALAYALGVWLRPAPELAGTELQARPQVGDVALVHAERGEVTLSELAGDDLTLVFFGFTRCPDVCPLTLARLAEIYRDLDEPEGLEVVMISVDPANDTPEATQRYAAQFHPAFVGVSGSNETIAAAAKAFFVGYRAGPDGDVIHTDMVMVVDPQGRFRYVYGQDKVMRLGQDLPVLIAGG